MKSVSSFLFTTLFVTIAISSTTLAQPPQVQPECVILDGPVLGGNCFIDNVCYTDGTFRTFGDFTSVCQSCESSRSSTTWSVVTPNFLGSTAPPPNDCVAIPTDTYQSCNVPSFEWATFGRRSSARMYGMKGSVDGNYLYAAGYLKSTVDRDVTADVNGEMVMRGPYSDTDPTGTNATQVVTPITSYPASQGARENAGGSFGQYEVGIVRIDVRTGTPDERVLVHGGIGLDETTGLVAKMGKLAVSGHFTGNLTVPSIDGTMITIVNSNYVAGQELPDQDMQFHPNARDGSGLTGEDDGFIIKMDPDTGLADWMIRYPDSNRDAQTVSVDMDDDGHVYGVGYRCSVNEEDKIEGSPPMFKNCVAVVVKLNSTNGAVVWERIFDNLGGASRVTYDAADGALYVLGTTTYGGENFDSKTRADCPFDSCAVVMRLDSTDGTIDWVRTVYGSPRLGVFDQTGDVEVHGDYLYVAIDDVGDGNIGPVSLEHGTGYASCRYQDGEKDIIVPEYDIDTTKVVTSDDCANSTATFVNRTAPNALPANYASTSGTESSSPHCGNSNSVDACLIRYHKYTGRPMWGVDLPPVSGIVVSPDGASLTVAGWYYPGRAEVQLDSLILPGYLREGGLGSQTSGLYHASLSTANGRGEYVLHSGGGSKDRLYDIVGDDEGNVYSVGYSMNLKMQWGGANKLTTIMTEEDANGDTITTQSEAMETHLYVSKLDTTTTTTSSCLTSCTDTTATATINPKSCFIDGVCYAAGEKAELFGKGPCFVCRPDTSQREWTADVDTVIGTSHCYVDNICVPDGTFFWSQRRTWAPPTFSLCQACNATHDGYAWSLVKEQSEDENMYELTGAPGPPLDCRLVNETTTIDSPGQDPPLPPKTTTSPTQSPVVKDTTTSPTLPPVVKDTTNSPTQSPVVTTDKTPIEKEKEEVEEETNPVGNETPPTDPKSSASYYFNYYGMNQSTGWQLLSLYCLVLIF